MKTSEIVAALEHLVGAVRRDHPEIPEVAIYIPPLTTRRCASGGYVRGTGGVWIAAHRLWDDARLVAQTVLHQLVHALADARGIQECSRGGYHNGKFAALAEEVVLTRPKRRDRSRGWADCTLAELTARRYRTEIDALAAVLPSTGRGRKATGQLEVEDKAAGPNVRRRNGPKEAMGSGSPVCGHCSSQADLRSAGTAGRGTTRQPQPAQLGSLRHIARRHLDIKTLKTRGQGSLDFHTLPVWDLRSALSAAYRAGAANEIRRLERPTLTPTPEVIGTTTRYIGNEVAGLDEVTIWAVVPRQILAKELGLDVHREGYCVMDDRELRQRGGVTQWDRVVVTYVDPEQQETFAADKHVRAIDLECFAFLRE